MMSARLLKRVNNQPTDAHNRIVNHFCKTADNLSIWAKYAQSTPQSHYFYKK